MYIFMWRIWILRFWLLPLLQPGSVLHQEVPGVSWVVLSVKEQGGCCWVTGEETEAAVPEI